MIPKIIHYCWFGKNPKPKLALKCIKSWKKYCPDYKIIEWNEDNFDLNYNDYVKEAYEAKKWAFVTDVVRLYALVNFGGIYMDTDVEVIKSLDEFLKLSAFSGFERVDSVPTGIMAAEKGQELFTALLNDYNGQHFINKDGSLNTTTNVVRITDYCLKEGLELNNKEQTVRGFTLFPKEYFCPKDFTTGIIELTENTYTIHHFNASWLNKTQIDRHKLLHKLIKKYGIENYENGKILAIMDFEKDIVRVRKEKGFIYAFFAKLKNRKKYYCIKKVKNKK